MNKSHKPIKKMWNYICPNCRWIIHRDMPDTFIELCKSKGYKKLGRQLLKAQEEAKKYLNTLPDKE